MKPAHLIITLCLALLAMACNEKKESISKKTDIEIVDIKEPDVSEVLSSSDTGFPEVKNSNEFKKTEFLLTPENTIPKDKNAVYCTTMLLAWNQLRSIAGAPIVIDKKFQNLALLNSSKAYINTLKKGEYEVAIELNPGGESHGVFRAVAKLTKQLQFPAPFESYKGKLIFDGEKVASFGVYNSEYFHHKQFDILNYENDSRFLLQLKPNDTMHEILLYMTDQKPGTMADAFNEIENKRKIREKEYEKYGLQPKYTLNNDDVISIPKFLFNIQDDFESIKGNEYALADFPYQIRQMTQRTAFKLDERGADIESEALVAYDSVSVEKVKPRPKKLIFNKPFLVVLKRVDSSNPYFAMWVDNTELMIKE